MLPTIFWENMEIIEITTAKLTGAHGIILHSEKTNRDFSTGGLHQYCRLKVGDTVLVFISCNRIHQILSLDKKKRYFG